MLVCGAGINGRAVGLVGDGRAFAVLVVGAEMSKYRNVPTTYFGIRFHSKKEAERYLVLRSLQEENKISDLQLQVAYPVIINGVKICDYKADFVYHVGTGGIVVEDVKGVRTPEYKLKRKLIRAVYGVVIKET